MVRRRKANSRAASLRALGCGTSVIDRLRLIYGSAAELRIESRLGEGTAVTVLLPLACEEEEWNLHCGQDE